MNPDEYIRRVVMAHTPANPYVVEEKIDELRPHIHTWANGHEYEIRPSGSLAKGTAIIGTSDMDIFISLNPSVSTCNTLENVYNTLRNRFHASGHSPREQNVSVGITHSGLKIDVVAGVRHHVLGQDHSIWKRKARTWTKTNVDEHVRYVVGSGRISDIKAVKIWRKLRGLDFPSFYLEMSVIEALRGKLLAGSPSEHFVAVMNYLANDLRTKTIKDPANSANEVSEDLTDNEKMIVANAAARTLQGGWQQAIW